jgi:hypothetical protein
MNINNPDTGNVVQDAPVSSETRANSEPAGNVEVAAPKQDITIIKTSGKVPDKKDNKASLVEKKPIMEPVFIITE